MAINHKAALKYELYCRSVKYYNDHRKAQDDESCSYIYGDQNIRRATDDEQNDFVINILFKQMQIMQSMLCRDVPSLTLHYLFDDEEWGPKTEYLQRIMVQNWRTNEMPLRLVELTSNGIIFGRAFLKDTWDKTMRMGLGDQRIEVPDSRNIIFLPGIGDVRKSLILYERKYLDKLTVLHMFPDQKDAVDAAFKIATPESSQGDFVGGGGTPQYATSGGYSTYSWADSNSGRSDERPVIELIEEWSQDPTTLKMVPELFQRIEKTPAYKALPGDAQDAVANKPIYPRGRLCVFSGEHEFSSSPNPFPSFPYMQFKPLTLPAAKMGDELAMGPLEQGKEIQDMLNTRQNQITDAFDHTALGGFGMAGSGVVDPEEFDSKPRRVYQKKMPGDFDWFNPPTIPAEAFKSVSDIRAMGDDVLNIHGILSSGDTKDIRSGQGVAELTEIANRVSVPATYALEGCFRSLTRYQISMVGSPFYRPGIHYPETMDFSGISPDAFEIAVVAGLNLPMSKASSQATLFRLYETRPPVIDGEALLDAIDPSLLPDKERIKERMKAKEMQAQEMQNQQAQSEMAVQDSQAQANRASAYENVVPMQQGA